MGFDYIMKVPLLPSCCGFVFVFGCRLSSLVDLSLFFDGHSTVSCDLGVFIRGDKLKFLYSAILSGIEGLLLVWMLAASFLRVSP